MKTNHASRLAAKVAARNHVHQIALEKAGPMIDALRPFLGEKIIKVDGALTAKVSKALGRQSVACDLTEGVHGSYYTTGHGYNVSAVIKVCHSSQLSRDRGQVADYADATIYLGDLAHGVLSKLYDVPTLLRTDYTEAEILTYRAELKAAQKALSEAQSKLYHFGEYDN